MKPPIVLYCEGELWQSAIEIVNLLRDGTPIVQLVTWTILKDTSQETLFDTLRSFQSELLQLLDNLALANEMFEVKIPFRVLFVNYQTREFWLIHEINSVSS